MTPEQYLLSALSAVTGTLVVFAKILWAKAQQCEADRNQLRAQVLECSTIMSRLEGLLMAYRSCPVKECPFPNPPNFNPLQTVFTKGPVQLSQQQPP